MSYSIVIANRLNWIDWAKTLAILSVVFGHIPEDNSSFFIKYIVQFHMPLFFFISGYLTKKELYNKSTINKYWQTLIIPYICYNILFYPYWVVRHIIDFPGSGWFDFVKPFIGTLLFQFKTSISDDLNGVTWFIGALLVMKIILSICNKHKYGMIAMSVFSIIVAFIYITNEYYRFYTALPFVGFIRCLPFFYLGYVCRHRHIIPERPKLKDIYICIIGITISIITYTFERVNPGLIIYGLCFWIICISAIGGVLSICKLLDNVHLTIIENISVGTIVIMGLHWILIGITNYTLSKLLHIPNIVYPLWIAILLTILFAAILYPVILLFRNKYPFMLGKQLKAIQNMSNVSKATSGN
jgi:fucose 4-O-acetylase-like acetyltransferase